MKEFVIAFVSAFVVALVDAFAYPGNVTFGNAFVAAFVDAFAYPGNATPSPPGYGLTGMPCPSRDNNGTFVGRP